jgi:hypothetical protein
LRLSPHPARAGPSGLITRGRTIRSGEEIGSSAGPLTATVVAASSLSVGSGVVVIVVFGVHLTTSAPFWPGHNARYPAGYPATTNWRGWPCCHGFPLRFRRRRSLLGHPVPAGELSVPYGRPTGPPKDRAGPRRGFHVPHAQDTTGVGALYSPGTVVPSRPTTIIGLHLARLNAVSLHRATSSITARLRLTSHQRGFKQFARPVFPSPVASGWIASPSAFPRASHPALAGGARRGGDGSLKHGSETSSTASAEPPISRVYLKRATSCRTRGSGLAGAGEAVGCVSSARSIGCRREPLLVPAGAGRPLLGRARAAGASGAC